MSKPRALINAKNLARRVEAGCQRIIVILPPSAAAALTRIRDQHAPHTTTAAVVEALLAYPVPHKGKTK